MRGAFLKIKLKINKNQPKIKGSLFDIGVTFKLKIAYFQKIEVDFLVLGLFKRSRRLKF